MSSAAAEHEKPGASEDTAAHQLSRAERRARESLLKLGFIPVRGILRVTLRRGKSSTGAAGATPGSIFAITTPEVLYAPGTETYVVLGQARSEDIMASAKQALAAQQRMTAAALAAKQVAAATNNGASVHSAKKPDAAAVAAATAFAGAADAEPVDESGLDNKDIELVMTQANVSRAVAVKMLLAHNGDVVEAIMELTI